MQDLTITCTECGAIVAVTESLAAPMLEASKRDFDRKLSAKNDEIRRKTSEIENSQRFFKQLKPRWMKRFSSE